MINRNRFNETISNLLDEKCIDKNFVTSMQKIMKNKHEIQPGRTSALLNMRSREFDNVDIKELAWLANSIKTTLKTEELDEFFTDSEKMLINTKEIEKVLDKYPVRIKVQKVLEDQYIAVTDVNFIYELYRKQLICYNKETQRPQKQKRVNGKIVYKISLNKQSVNEIARDMNEDSFIPNAITLNINMDKDNDFDVNNEEIILNNGVFDIIDGFHRYQAMMKNKIANNDFNYPVIVNIMIFDQMKACNYIAQEDKRNKIDSKFIKALDSNNPLNMVIDRLNSDKRCFLNGEFSTVIGTTKIYSPSFLKILEACRFSANNTSEIMKLSKYLKEVLNALVEDELLCYDDSFKMHVILAACKKYKEDIDSIDKIENVCKNIDKFKIEKYKVATANHTDMIIEMISNMEENGYV